MEWRTEISMKRWMYGYGCYACENEVRAIGIVWVAKN